MKTILVFTTSSGRARTETLDGVREFFNGIGWDIQNFEYEGRPFPVRELVRFWNPVGCIVEISGNDLSPNTIPKDGFGSTPVVYLGFDSALSPPGATCIIHDARGTAKIVSRELLARHDLRHFAFVGLDGHAWSLRREEAYVKALSLNGKSATVLNLRTSPSAGHRNEFERLKRWLIELKKPCGLFAADDSIAKAVLAICRNTDIDIPEELAVIGVDDNEDICLNTKPSLSSVRPDFRQAGRFSARILSKKILKARHIPKETLFASSSLTRRGSTRTLVRADKDVADAIERIHAPDGVFLTPSEILAKFPCSRRNAEIRFRLATGHSVLDELMSARIEQAKNLLQNTNLPVSEIAISCGYRFPARLIAAFREAMGTTPLKWRKRPASASFRSDTCALHRFQGRPFR